MRHTIELDETNQWAILRYNGPATLSDSIALLHELVAMPGWTPRCARIVVYDNGDVARMDMDDIAANIETLAGVVKEAYGDTPSYNAHVCADRYKQSFVNYWISIAARHYGTEQHRFDTIPEAQAWILRQRAAEGLTD